MCQPPVIQGQVSFTLGTGKISIYFIICANGHFRCLCDTDWSSGPIHFDPNVSGLRKTLAFLFPLP